MSQAILYNRQNRNMGGSDNMSHQRHSELIVILSEYFMIEDMIWHGSTVTFKSVGFHNISRNMC